MAVRLELESSRRQGVVALVVAAKAVAVWRGPSRARKTGSWESGSRGQERTAEALGGWSHMSV